MLAYLLLAINGITMLLPLANAGGSALAAMGSVLHAPPLSMDNKNLFPSSNGRLPQKGTLGTNQVPMARANIENGQGGMHAVGGGPVLSSTGQAHHRGHLRIAVHSAASDAAASAFDNNAIAMQLCANLDVDKEEKRKEKVKMVTDALDNSDRISNLGEEESQRAVKKWKGLAKHEKGRFSLEDKQRIRAILDVQSTDGAAAVKAKANGLLQLLHTDKYIDSLKADPKLKAVMQARLKEPLQLVMGARKIVNDEGFWLDTNPLAGYKPWQQQLDQLGSKRPGGGGMGMKKWGNLGRTDYHGGDFY